MWVKAMTQWLNKWKSPYLHPYPVVGLSNNLMDSVPCPFLLGFTAEYLSLCLHFLNKYLKNTIELKIFIYICSKNKIGNGPNPAIPCLPQPDENWAVQTYLNILPITFVVLLKINKLSYVPTIESTSCFLHVVV